MLTGFIKHFGPFGTGVGLVVVGDLLTEMMLVMVVKIIVRLCLYRWYCWLELWVMIEIIEMSRLIKQYLHILRNNVDEILNQAWDLWD